MPDTTQPPPQFVIDERMPLKPTLVWWKCNDCQTTFGRDRGIEPRTRANPNCNDNANRRRWADLLQQNEELEQRLEKVEAWMQQQETYRQEQNERR